MAPIENFPDRYSFSAVEKKLFSHSLAFQSRITGGVLRQYYVYVYVYVCFI